MKKIKTNIDLQRMKMLMKMSDNNLKKFLKEFLIKYNYLVIEHENFLIAAGDSSISLVAHLDTVFVDTYKDKEERDLEFFYDNEQKVLWSPDGMGADDRAGVYAIMDIIEADFRPSVIFTLGEEIGGVGANELVLYYPNVKEILPNVKFLIELDRYGKNDCVFYRCDNDKFISWVEKYDFIFDLGSYSDISVLAPAWGIAAVNLSVGYYDEHSLCERLYIDYLLNTISKVKKMIKDCDCGKGPESTIYIPKKIKINNNNKQILCNKCLVCKKPVTLKTSVKYGGNYICDTCFSHLI